MSKRVAVYARVSTTRQAENDISIPDQLSHAKRYCTGKGWHIVREFVDAGASARDEKRPKFQNLMDMACVDPSPVDVVIVHSISRFFRDVAGYTFWKRKLEKHGVSLVSITQSFGEGTSANFAETVLAAADQYHSEETAKHVTRTMLENARQGHWNGAKPPLGYRTVAVEQRGQRTKKRLEIEPREAEIVRQIFKLCLDGDGTRGPMGVKDIASWLNGRRFKNANGNPFYTSEVHSILTRETYAGTHYYNRVDSRTRKERPRADWITVPAPVIISEADFRRVQDLLHQRRPNVIAPRISNSAVLLTGIARCETCGAALMLRTGKSGKYRYYACASHKLKGKNACKNPIAVPEAQLNRLVLEALTDQLLTPERLPKLLNDAQRHRRMLASGGAQRRLTLRKQLREADRQLQRLYAALADGTVTDTDTFRGTVKELEAKRDETIRLLSLLDIGAPPLRQAISKAQSTALAAKLRRGLLEAPARVQRRYVRGLVSEIVVDREKAIIAGPKAAIGAAITSGDLKSEVRTSVREWRTRQDSNL